jgi:hypothetical protein
LFGPFATVRTGPIAKILSIRRDPLGAKRLIDTMLVDQTKPVRRIEPATHCRRFRPVRKILIAINAFGRLIVRLVMRRALASELAGKPYRNLRGVRERLSLCGCAISFLIPFDEGAAAGHIAHRVVRILCRCDGQSDMEANVHAVRGIDQRVGLLFDPVAHSRFIGVVDFDK